MAGSVGVLCTIFGTSLEVATEQEPDGTVVTYRERTGNLSLPAALDGVVIAVLGLDDRPQTRTRFQIAAPAAVTTSYTPPQLAEIYQFPAGTDGTGQTVAILELGGGFTQAELTSYFRSLGITPPTVTAVGVDGGANRPEQNPNGADGEVMLDIEIVGAMAPGADIVVYFAPNTDAGFLDALSQAAHARHHAGRDQHQLGTERGCLDGAGPHRLRPGLDGRGRARRDGHRRGRRRR